MKINHRYCHITFVAIIAAVMAISSCNEKKFQVTGKITDAKDSILYFEHMSLNGPGTVRSPSAGKTRARRSSTVCA
jgi:hypothetical protein